MKFNCREDIIQLTPQWTGERSTDGRPHVSDNLLQRMKAVTTEEAWFFLFEKGYKQQFEGNWLQLSPGSVLVGRAVTSVFVPSRIDLHDCLEDLGHRVEGRIGGMNSWVIETLVKDDVVVVDMFGKIIEGTFAGGNLSTAIATRTGTGMVVYGGIRDAQQVLKIDSFSVFCKGIDPTGINLVTLVGLNTPCRISGATCMPGDVVLGTVTGVIFIPPQFAQEIVEYSEKLRLRDAFGFIRLREGKYTSSQMDSQWTPEIEADYSQWYARLSPEALERLLASG